MYRYPEIRVPVIIFYQGNLTRSTVPRYIAVTTAVLLLNLATAVASDSKN
eukprot:SAG11_NODE_6323_length_1336_cov_2.672595_1_plen_50_part_00